jgi:MFS family permease
MFLSINYGARYCFGIFVKPLSEEYGWSRSVISLGATLNMLSYSVCAILIGRIIDRTAPRWIITGGALIASSGFILLNYVKTPLEFYVAYGLLVGMGSSGLGLVVTNASAAKWFISKRGVAIGISTMGISFGTIILTPMAGYIVTAFTWREGFLFLGMLIFVVGVVLSQILMKKTRPEAYGLNPDGVVNEQIGEASEEPLSQYKISYFEMFLDFRFWNIAIAYGLIVLTMITVFVHQVPYAQDNGIDKLAAASSLGVLGIAGFLGQFFFGYLSDRFDDPKYSAILGIVIMIAGMLILLQVKSVPLLYTYTIVYGFGYGSIAPMMILLPADRFGRHVLGSVYGMITFFIGLIGSTGPVLGGLLFDYFDSYQLVWQFNIAFLMTALFIILSLRPSNAATHRKQDTLVTDKWQIDNNGART